MTPWQKEAEHTVLWKARLTVPEPELFGHTQKWNWWASEERKHLELRSGGPRPATGGYLIYISYQFSQSALIHITVEVGKGREREPLGLIN